MFVPSVGIDGYLYILKPCTRKTRGGLALRVGGTMPHQFLVLHCIKIFFFLIYYGINSGLLDS
jgi:hypothetical protein